MNPRFDYRFIGSSFGAVCLVSSLLISASGCGDESSSTPPLAVSIATAPPDSGARPPEPLATSSLPPRVQAVTDELRSLVTCEAHAWGSYRWTDKQILLVANGTKDAYLWNDQNETGRGTTHAVSFDALPDSLRETFYFDILDYQGKSTLAISLDFTGKIKRQYADMATSLAIHEGFHVWAQKDWYATNREISEASDRDPDYPDTWRLRYLRAQLLKALRASAMSGAPLGAAAYWRQLLGEEFSPELKSLAEVDAVEGSASFVTAMLAIQGRRGCDVADDDIVRDIGAYDSEFVDAKTAPLSANGEPYDIGLFSLLLLGRQGKPGFEDEIAHLRAPADVLLEGVTPLPQIEDAQARDAAKGEIEKRNQSASTWIEPLLRTFHDPTEARLAIPWDWVQGAFSMKDAYRVLTEPGTPAANSEFTATLAKDGAAVGGIASDLLVTETTPCGGAFMLVIPLANDDFSLTGSSIRTSTSRVSVAGLTVAPATDGDGRSWLCAQ
jgi:hypothetical protein